MKSEVKGTATSKMLGNTALTILVTQTICALWKESQTGNLEVLEGVLRLQLTAFANDCSEDGKVIKGYKKLAIMEEATEFCCS